VLLMSLISFRRLERRSEMYLASIMVTIIRYYGGVHHATEHTELPAEAGRKCGTMSGLSRLPPAGS
jgi:hypothetical protein